MKIVTVIPLKKSVFKEELTYFTLKNIKNGDIVDISIRNKKMLGLVISCQDATTLKSGVKKMPFNLKKIDKVKEHSMFRKEFLESVFANGEYFVADKNTAITSFVPAILKEEYDKIAKLKNGTVDNINGSKNIRVEKLLLQAPLEDRISFYKTLIRGSFAEKKSVFMVLPTEKDIENFTSLLSKGIENFTFAIHGGFAKKKTMETIKGIITSIHPILVLGTAPFLAIPRYDLGTVVIEQENTSTYKMINRPYFDLRTFVEIFTAKINAKLILADSLLQFDTLGRKELDGFGEVYPISYRVTFDGEIEIEGRNVSVSEQPKEKKFKILTDRSIEEIKNYVAKGKNVFIFSLRKGLATLTLCKDCSEPLMCQNCSAPLVLYLSRDGKKRMFICNRCKEETSTDTKCALCSSWNLIPLGIGTDTVSEEVKKIFPKVKMFRLDKESVKNKKEAEKVIEEFEEQKGAILIGTEMASFYLKNKISVSIIASFDSLWSIPNFRMNEKIIKLITAIISKTKEKLIIQTKNERDPAILALKTENLSSFVREELADRKKFDYPPYKRFIKIKYLGNKEQTVNTRRILAETLKEYHPEIFSGFVTQLKGKYITNTLIKINTKTWSLPELSANSHIDQTLASKLTSLPPLFEIFIDPEDLL